VGRYGALQIDGDNCQLRCLDAKALPPAEASPDTPADGAGFGNAEKLQWIEEQFPVAPKQKFDFWHEVYKATKLGEKFVISLEDARDNVHILDLARKGTAF
jgi:hypothetical protein